MMSRNSGQIRLGNSTHQIPQLLLTVVIFSVSLLTVAAPESIAAPRLLTEPPQTVAVPPEVHRTGPEVIRSRYVLVQLDLIQPPPTVQPGTLLLLELFPDTAYTVTLNQFQHGFSGHVWVGSAVGIEASLVILSVVDNAFFAHIWIRPGERYMVEPCWDEVYRVVQINDARLPMTPDDAISPPIPPSKSPAPLSEPPTTPDPATVIDVLLVYTPAVRAALGGTSPTLAALNAEIAVVNTAYANSEITQRLRLVYAAEVSYTESGNMNTDLSRLANPSDGYMDVVHTWRNTYGADVVSLYVESGQYCGLGYWMTKNSLGPQFAPWAFSVILRTCMGGLVLAHELGHNMAAHHDWYVAANDLNSAAYTYVFGYVKPGGGWKDIMAYGDMCWECPGFTTCPTIPFFSNPYVTYEGVATGVPGGTNTSCTLDNCNNPPCDADVARTLDNTAPIVANFRQVSGPPTNDAFANAQVLSGSSGVITGWSVGATKETGEPNHAGDDGGASVWYRWTAPASGTVVIGTHGSNFDTLLAVYTGTSVGSLTLVAQNDDVGCDDFCSRVRFNAVGGTTYRIAVDGYNWGSGPAQGMVVLSWGPDSAPLFSVKRETGDVRTDGWYYGSQYISGSADLAEWVPVSEPVEPGDVLELDPIQPGKYRRARGPCSTLVAGVVSSKPGVVLGHSKNTAGKALLALIGVVPVKVTDENGPIRVGDLLVASSTPGHAMRWDPETRCGEGLIGKALEAHETGQGLILVLLMR